MFFGDVCFVDGITAATHVEAQALSVVARGNFTKALPEISPSLQFVSSTYFNYGVNYWKLGSCGTLIFEVLICKDENCPYFLELLESGLGGPSLMTISINGSVAVRRYRVYGSGELDCQREAPLCWDRFEISGLLKNGMNRISFMHHPDGLYPLALGQLLITTR